MNISLMEAEIFAIKYSIGQVSQIQDITCIVVITDTIHVAKCILNTSIHSHKLYTIIISSDLGNFFNRNVNNSISFWDCSSNDKQPPYLLVNKESKHHKINLILSSKSSQKFSKKEECNSIVKKWQMYFQASDYKENQ